MSCSSWAAHYNTYLYIHLTPKVYFVFSLLLSNLQLMQARLQQLQADLAESKAIIEQLQSEQRSERTQCQAQSLSHSRNLSHRQMLKQGQNSSGGQSVVPALAVSQAKIGKPQISYISWQVSQISPTCA